MSDAKIFLLGGSDGQLLPMTAAHYAAEAVLQGFVADYPELLPGDQIDPDNPRRWLLVSREMGVPGEAGKGARWSLDHLLLDQDGIPTFLECKRASDTRTRREVVGQMLDYAANGTEYWSMASLRQAAAETAEKMGKSLDNEIRRLCGLVEEVDVEPFWQNVERNLREGRVRLIFVTDETPRELRRLVEFLNQKMPDVEVLAVEITLFEGKGQKALVPRVIGFVDKPEPGGHKELPRSMIDILGPRWAAGADIHDLASEAGVSWQSLVGQLLAAGYHPLKAGSVVHEPPPPNKEAEPEIA